MMKINDHILKNVAKSLARVLNNIYHSTGEKNASRTDK
jgi:hypothetical protein